MNAADLWAALAIASIPVTGIPFVRALGLRGPLGWGATWLFGCGFVTLGMAILCLAHVRFTRLSLAVVWLVALALWLVVERASGSPTGTTQPEAGGTKWLAEPIAWLMAAICVFQVGYVLLVSLRVPLGSFDSWALWDFKGVRFWLDGGITRDFLGDSAAVFAHPAYPPLIPLLIAWVYTWSGASDPVLMKPIFAFFFAALILVLVGAFEVRFGRRIALLGGASVVLIPRIPDYAGTGLADVPLAAFIVAGAAALATARHESFSLRLCVASGTLFGLGMLTKHDAVPFIVSAFAMLVALRCPLRGLVGVAGPAALISAPWYIAVLALGAPDRDFHAATLANIVQYAWRIPNIARLFALNMLAFDEWSLLWIALAVLALRGLAVRRPRSRILLIPVIVPLAFYIGSLSLSAWPDYLQHARTSLDRLILMTTPFGLWFVFEQLAPQANVDAEQAESSP